MLSMPFWKTLLKQEQRIAHEGYEKNRLAAILPKWILPSIGLFWAQS
jgi:hypothetical protein